MGETLDTQKQDTPIETFLFQHHSGLFCSLYTDVAFIADVKQILSEKFENLWIIQYYFTFTVVCILKRHFYFQNFFKIFMKSFVN